MNFSKKNHSLIFGKNTAVVVRKNAILKTKYVLLALIIGLTFSCSPEDGEIGPQGLAGEDGNANVTSIIIEDVSLQVGISNHFSIPELTRDIVNNGVVIGYVGQASAWEPLPLIQNDSKIIAINLLTDGQIRVYSKIDISNIDLRFVLIEGN